MAVENLMICMRRPNRARRGCRAAPERQAREEAPLTRPEWRVPVWELGSCSLPSRQKAVRSGMRLQDRQGAFLRWLARELVFIGRSLWERLGSVRSGRLS